MECSCREPSARRRWSGRRRAPTGSRLRGPATSRDAGVLAQDGRGSDRPGRCRPPPPDRPAALVPHEEICVIQRGARRQLVLPAVCAIVLAALVAPVSQAADQPIHIVSPAGITVDGQATDWDLTADVL